LLVDRLSRAVGPGYFVALVLGAVPGAWLTGSFLELKEGDEIEVRVAAPRIFEIDRDRSHEAALATIRSFRKELPPDWKFDREEANSR